MAQIDTALLRTFVHLADSCSFSRTAEAIGRSQSAVSTQIRKLEDTLNVELFARDRRNVRLTPEGEKLLGYAEQILRLSDAMFERFRQPEVSGEVRFGSPEDFATHYLPEILAAFADAHPDVFLHVTCDLTLRLIEQQQAGALDLIIIKQHPDAPALGAQPLWREALVWVGGGFLEPGMAMRDAAARFPHGRDYLPLVASPPPCVYRSRAIEALDADGMEWTSVYASPSFAGTVAAVRAGLGVTVLPASLVPEGLLAFGEQDQWPALQDAEISMVARATDLPAVDALAAFIRDRMTYRKNR